MGYSAPTPDGLLCFDAQASLQATRSPAGEFASVRGNAARGPFERAAMQVGDPNTVLVANPGADLYGSDRMAVETVRALIDAGLRVYVTVPAAGPLVDLLTAAGATVLEQPTPVIRKSLASPGGLLRLVRDSLAAVVPSRQLLRHTGAGTVLVNTITAPLWILLARLGRRRVICHVHEAEASASTLTRRLLYLPLVLCNRIVVNSRFSLDVLTDSAPALSSRTTFVYNAVKGPERVTSPPRRLSTPARVLFVGRLSKRKGPHVAIEAMRILKDRGREVHLSLLGAVSPGNEAFETELHAQVRQSQLSAHVEFLGFRPSIWPVLAENDIVVIPSTIDEPFGNTAVEASLAARPLIVSDIAGLKEASAEAAGKVMVPPADPTAIADAVEDIIDRWDSFCAQAKVDAANVAEAFSFERYSENLLKALELPTPAPS